MPMSMPMPVRVPVPVPALGVMVRVRGRVRVRVRVVHRNRVGRWLRMQVRVREHGHAATHMMRVHMRWIHGR